ncbi:MAG TPA: ABC transporter permease [Catalimonadaceae bacterium]|nr:ABC transporter permease [Catalimonadaceae bacterium]
MKFRLNLEIATGMLQARMKQSLIAAAGVTFGIAMYITLVGFMTGLNHLLDGLILNRTAHVRLYNEIKPSEKQALDLVDSNGNNKNFIRSVRPREIGKEILNSRGIMDALRADPRVDGLSPKVSAQVFFNSGSIDLAGVINGVNIREEDRLFFFSTYVTTGNVMDLENVPNSIFLGKGLAEKMLVEPGDMIQISTPRGETTLLKVVGIFQLGLMELDNTQSYTSLQTAQTILEQPVSYITDIQIKLKDLALAPALAKEYKEIFSVDAIDIQTANSQFETGTKVRTIISYAVSFALLIVAGFGIYNILNMLIYEKMDSIAILKATGFSGRDVRMIFLQLSMIIGIVGGIVGLGLGYALSVVVSNIPFETAALPTIKTYPVYFHIQYYFIGISFALVTTFLAGLLPALKASGIDPVIILRGK